MVLLALLQFSWPEEPLTIVDTLSSLREEDEVRVPYEVIISMLG